MKIILAPTDFSVASINAVNYAIYMAVEIEAEVVLLHVSQLFPVMIGAPEGFPMSFYTDTTELALNDLAASLRKKIQNKVVVKTRFEIGQVTFKIEEMCGLLKPFAIVMAAGRATTFEEILFGNILMYVAKHMTCPVIVVPEHCTYRPIHKIGIALDLSSVYEIPIAELSSILDIFQASLHVLHVSRTAEENEENGIKVSLLKQHLKNLNVSYHFATSDTVIETLQTIATKIELDILLTIPKKHGLFHKSISRQLTSHSVIPSVMIRPTVF